MCTHATWCIRMQMSIYARMCSTRYPETNNWSGLLSRSRRGPESPVQGARSQHRALYMHASRSASARGEVKGLKQQTRAEQQGLGLACNREKETNTSKPGRAGSSFTDGFLATSLALEASPSFAFSPQPLGWCESMTPPLSLTAQEQPACPPRAGSSPEVPSKPLCTLPTLCSSDPLRSEPP